MLWRNPSLLLFQQKRKLTQSTKERKHKPPIKQQIHPKRNKNDTVKSIDKSRSTQIDNTENTEYKSRSIPISNYSNRSTRIEKLSEINIHKDNLSISGSSVQVESLVSRTPDTPPVLLAIAKKKKTPYTPVIRKTPFYIENTNTIENRNKVHTTKWRTIYEVIEPYFFKKYDNFPDYFIKM